MTDLHFYVRTNLFTSPRRRLTLRENGAHGIQRSPPRQDCTHQHRSSNCYQRPLIPLVISRYALSVGLNRILRLPCTIPNLRLTDLALLQIAPFLTALLLRSIRTSPPKLPACCTGVKPVWKLRPPSPSLDIPPPRGFPADDSSSDTLALVLSTFPVFWFFGFLYYTDVGSAVGVIATVLLAKEGKHWLAAAVRKVMEWRVLTDLSYLNAGGNTLDFLPPNQHHLARIRLSLLHYARFPEREPASGRSKLPPIPSTHMGRG